MSQPINCTESELFTFLQGLEEGYLPTYFSDTNLSAPSRSNPIASKSFTSGNKTASFRGFPSLRMFKHSTADRGEEKLTSSQGASRAKTSAQPEKAQALKVQGLECGWRWHESSVKYDPVTSSWKTRQCSLLEGLDEFLETWPKWGMMRDGECWERTTPEHLTSGTESGLWPTPTANEDAAGTPDGKMQWMLTQAAKSGCSTRREYQNQKSGFWPTPDTCAVEKWAAPTTMDSLPPKSAKALHKEATQARPGRSKPANLRDQVSNSHMWPTPRQADYKGASSLSECTASRVANGQANLPEAVVESSENGGQLNPTWVEWLMGWPLFWTSLDTDVKPYYDSWHEAKQWTQASPEEIQSGIVRNVWWDIDPSTSPQGRQYNQQRQGECDDSVPTVPYEDPLFDRELGARECETSDLQDLRGDFQTQADTKVEAMWQAGMPKGKREAVGRVAVGVKARVDRLRCIGNGQVPLCAALAWKILSGGANQ